MAMVIASMMWVTVCAETVATGRFAFFLPGAVLGFVIYELGMWLVVSAYLKVFRAIAEKSKSLAVGFAIASTLALAWGLILNLGLYTSQIFVYQGHPTQLHILGALTVLAGSALVVAAATARKNL